MSFKTILYLVLALNGNWVVLAQTHLTLADAAARALSQNRDVLAAKMAAQAKENDALAAKTRRWPSLSVSGQLGPFLNRPSLTFTQGDLGTISIPRKLGGYTISQATMPISQQPRIDLNIRMAREDTEAARLEVAQIRNSAVARVRSLYFQMAALDSAQRTAQAQLQTAEEVTRLAQEGLAKGTALPADESRATAHLAQAKADVANISADLADAAEQLNLFMGAPLDAQFILTTEQLAESAVTQEEAQQHAVTMRPELKEARVRLEQAGLSVRSKHLEQIPDLSLYVSDIYFMNTSNYLPSQIASAGVSLTWEPWDWGRKQREAAALHAKEEQQRLALAQLEEQVKFESNRAWREYQRETRNYQASQAATQSAEEQLRVAKERYAKQAALMRDLLEAQTNWETAGQAEARARAAVGTAWANLQSAMGNE